LEPVQITPVTNKNVSLFILGDVFFIYISNFKRSCSSQRDFEQSIPPKFNMEPQNWWFVDVSPFPRGYVQVPCLFSGVYSIPIFQ